MVYRGYKLGLVIGCILKIEVISFVEVRVKGLYVLSIIIILGVKGYMGWGL